MKTRQQSTEILRTKLHRPSLSGDLLARGRALERMARAAEAPLTLVAAPAGYGKSVLVAQWVEAREHPCAWLSLDESDSDLRIFLQYLVAAIDTVSAGACRATRGLLEAPELPLGSVVARQLINDLDGAEGEQVIVLDDYHRIRQGSPVHDLMGSWLEHPPRQVHLVLVTRRDPPLPLAGLRAGNRLVEMRVRDLRFTPEETAELLAASGGISLGDEALGRLQREVEGWAVGLRLLLLVLRRVENPVSFLENLRGGIAETQDYLFQEVLAAHPPEIRRCMTNSSILDRFCADLLDVVNTPRTAPGEAEFDGRSLVDLLRRHDLFTIALDTRGEWFRYHHLFQELLRAQLEQAATSREITELHSRASEWFESRGLAGESIEHALAAGDTDRAAGIVERNREEVLNADQWYVLENWLARLPEEVVQQRAELLMARVWVLVHHSRFEAVPPLLDRVEALLGDDPDGEPLRGEVALLRGYMLFFLGHGAESLRYEEQALERVPVSFHEARAQAEVIFALASQMEGRETQALRGLDDLLAHYDSPSDQRRTRLLVTYVFIHFVSGDLTRAEASNRRLRTVVEGGRYAYAEAWADYLQGLIHLQRHELDAAVENLGRSVSRRFIHFKRAAVDSIAGLIFAYRALGRPDEEQATLQLLQEYVASLNDPALWVLAGSAEARLAVMQGRVEPATRWLRSDAPAGDEAMLWWLEVPSVTRCRVLIAEGSAAGLEEAEQRLRELAEVSEAHHNVVQRIGILGLLAVAREKQGGTAEALRFLERALTLARPGGFVLPFVELGAPMARLLGKLPRKRDDAAYVGEILSALGNAPERASGDSRTAVAPTGLDALTTRELDVLELLAQRLYNKEIAGRLFISPHTVSDHLKHIYQKLGVANRRQAVDRAVATGILGPDGSWSGKSSVPESSSGNG